MGVCLCPETFIIYSFWEHKSVLSDTGQYQNGFIECIPAPSLTSQRPVTVHLFKETDLSLGGNYCFSQVFLSHIVISSLINDRWNRFWRHNIDEQYINCQSAHLIQYFGAKIKSGSAACAAYRDKPTETT